MEAARMLKGITFRSTMEKVFDILEVAYKGSIEGQQEDVYKDGVIQSEIIDKAHLEDNQLKEYLRVLTENDLLSFDSATCKFRITQRGHRFVQLYNKMSDLLKEGQEQQI
jgi:predicted transcriptional regulator